MGSRKIKRGWKLEQVSQKEGKSKEVTLVKKETGFYKSFDGTSIYYECRGEGKPLIFIYGIACPMNHWMEQIRHFSFFYKTVIIDLRGHHKSSKPLKNNLINIESVARDIYELLKFLNIKKALFFGHSFGVQALLETYKFYPQVFHSCVFANGFFSYPLKTMRGGFFVYFIFFILKRGYRRFQKMFSKIWKVGFKNPFSILLSGLIGGFNLKLIEFKNVEIYFRGASNLNLDVFIPLFNESIQYDGVQTLNQMDVPCLIIGGKKDKLTPKKVQLSMHERLKKSDYILISKGTHCTPLDRPGLFNHHVEVFLKKLNY